jgi:hypothetical protein
MKIYLQPQYNQHLFAFWQHFLDQPTSAKKASPDGENEIKIQEPFDR